MAEVHEDPGSAVLARILVQRFHPYLLNQQTVDAETNQFDSPKASD